MNVRKIPDKKTKKRKRRPHICMTCSWSTKNHREKQQKFSRKKNDAIALVNPYCPFYTEFILHTAQSILILPNFITAHLIRNNWSMSFENRQFSVRWSKRWRRIGYFYTYQKTFIDEYRYCHVRYLPKQISSFGGKWTEIFKFLFVQLTTRQLIQAGQDVF